ncbi:MAG TPA: DeoR/GlpR family DNA-binding transcription regulator [Draconibacterium sp.]|nr:DeoR/GlpR family DNA-binding transcription regulator [Draconibacterium sp.]
MKKKERHAILLRELGNQKRLNLVEFSRYLGVSDDTLRRDMNELDSKGLLKKVHGGAVSRSSLPTGFQERGDYSRNEKARLADKAVAHIKNGDVIIIDGGTTNLEVVKKIPIDFSGTVFTNSLPLAGMMCNYPGVKLIFLGGLILKESQVTVGHEVISALEDFTADVYFMGVHAVHSELGISVPDHEEAMVKKAMARNAEKVIVLPIAEKLNTASTYRICSTDDVILIKAD